MAFESLRDRRSFFFSFIHYGSPAKFDLKALCFANREKTALGFSRTATKQSFGRKRPSKSPGRPQKSCDGRMRGPLSPIRHCDLATTKPGCCATPLRGAMGNALLAARVARCKPLATLSWMLPDAGPDNQIDSSGDIQEWRC